MNIGVPWPSLDEARVRVLGIQTKLHQWAMSDASRRFDDLFNLVCDPAFLLLAWHRVRGNKGARTAGVDGETAYYVETVRGVERFLAELRTDLKARTFTPLPVRERLITKRSGKLPRLGIATVRDRVVQAALKLVLEPIWETDFRPSSYGFRPNRRAHDALAETHLFTSRSYEWVLEADIEACFDQISHSALMERVRERVGDKRVLALVKAFLKAGVLNVDGQHQDTHTGTPQGGILSPVLANLALSVLDDHFHRRWPAASHVCEARRRKGLANYRLVRYADDFVVLVAGDHAHAEQVREEVAAVLAPMGLRLSQDKTAVRHIDEGFDFLGHRIQRHTQRGSDRRFVYTYPTKASLAAVKAKVRTITRQGTNLPLKLLLHRLNPVLRGWTYFFRHAASAKTFAYLHAFVWRRVIRWLRRKHPRAPWKQLRRRHLPDGWPTADGVVQFDPQAVTIVRYRYRGNSIPTPWSQQTAA